MKTINEVFETYSLLYGDKIMFETYKEEQFSFSQISEKVKDVQNVLYYYGVRKGDHVAVLVDDSPEWVISYFAITTMGAIIVPLLIYKDANIINKIATASKCKYLILDKTILREKTLVDLKEDTPLCIIDSNNYECIISPCSNIDFDCLEGSALSLTLPKVNIDPYDLAALQICYDKYSIRTIAYSHEELVMQARLNAAKYKSLSHEKEDVYMSILPLSMMYKKLSSVMVPIINGCISMFKPKTYRFYKIVSLIDEIRPTILITAPKFIEIVYKSSMVNRASKELINASETKAGNISSYSLRKQGSKIYKHLGGKIRYCLTDKIENNKVEKFLKASGLKSKMKFWDI